MNQITFDLGFFLQIESIFNNSATRLVFFVLFILQSVRKRITRSLSQRLLRSSSHGGTAVKSKLRKLGLLSATVTSSDLVTPGRKGTPVQPLEDVDTPASGHGNTYNVKVGNMCII